MEPRENFSTEAPQPNDGDEALSGWHVPPINLDEVRGSKRFPDEAPHWKFLKVKSLYWKTGPMLRSPKLNPGFCLSVHLLSVLLGQENGGALLKPVATTLDARARMETTFFMLTSVCAEVLILYLCDIYI